jgi:DNA-3-methyladenine glycosylase II
MAFPIEGRQQSAAVRVRQTEGGVTAEIHGTDQVEAARRQALAVLSLDIDARGYPRLGTSDPVIGKLQQAHGYLRPVLFHSPYEAACAFVIGHRIRIAQGRAIRARMAVEHGEEIDAGGTRVHAFPSPYALLRLDAIPGVDDEKVQRLHGIAEAALDGRLDRDRLRAIPVDDALAEVQRLRGIGRFFATGIVMRGAGLVDAFPDDDITRAGIRRFYALPEPPSDDELVRITDGWRPYRTWCSVLVHASERRVRSE